MNAAAQTTENQMAASAKKTEIVAEAQSFLSDVGKSYFTQLEKEKETLQLTVSSKDKIVENLREQLNKAFFEREEMRMKLAALQEEESEGKNKIAEKTSESVMLNERIKTLESDNKDLSTRLDKSNSQVELGKLETQRIQKELDEVVAESKKINAQLEEANRRLDEAYSRFDQERGRAERLEKDFNALRKQVDGKT
jgi:chromosome segregation ATPase